jgi:SNF2 family DNA or RNA helicase
MTEVGVHGLNLQTASAIVNYDLPWNPSNLKQRIGRVRRLKSEHDTILAINLISNNTLDDYILKLLSSKVDLFNATVEGVQKMVMDDFWGQDTE